MNGLHKVRFVTEEAKTHIFLDDTEVEGCVGAMFAYEVGALPLVKLLIHAVNIEVESDVADVEVKDVRSAVKEMEQKEQREDEAE